MPTKPTAKYPHRWPDGSYHSITWADHQFNQTKAKPGEIKIAAPGGGFMPVSEWDFGYGKGVMQAPVVTPQPFDPVFEAQKQAAQYQRDLAGAEGAVQRGYTAFDTGYNADGSANAANPYSQAMLLQDSYKRSQAGTMNSYAAQGQLYSGARQNAAARDDRNYSQSSNALREQARRQYHQIGYGQLGAYAQNSLGVAAGDYDALRRQVYGG